MELKYFGIEGMTIAVNNMDEMVEFYSNVFYVRFEEQEMFNAKLYSGMLGVHKLLFCPSTVAKITAKQNRHQLNIIVPDIEAAIAAVNNNGGTIIGEVLDNEHFKTIGIHDPDGNSMVIKELKETE